MKNIINKKSIVIKIDLDKVVCNKKDFVNSKLLNIINADICKFLKNTDCIKPIFLQYKISPN